MLNWIWGGAKNDRVFYGRKVKGSLRFGVGPRRMAGSARVEVEVLQ